MLVWFISLIGLMTLCVFIGKKFFKDKAHEIFKVTVTSTIIVGAWLAWLLVSILAPTIGTQTVAVVPVENDPWYDTHTIRYDPNEDSYFYNRTSWLNLFQMEYRVYLDADKVEKYLEIEQELKEIDLFG